MMRSHLGRSHLDDEKPMETRSSHYENLQSQRNEDNNKEMANDKNIQTITPEDLSRPQRQHSPNNWMDEGEDFFYDLFAERTNTTKKSQQKIIPSSEEQGPPEMSQHVLKEIQTPFVTPTKELSSTPLPQQPRKPKVAMRDLNEGKSTPASATREMFKPKTFATLLGSKIDDGTFSIAKTRERRAVKYPK